MEGGSSVIAKTADGLKGKFSSEYMSQQIELMVSMQSTNPTNAIGMVKELIESCCKTILEDLGIAWSKTDDVPQLTSKKTVFCAECFSNTISREHIKIIG